MDTKKVFLETMNIIQFGQYMSNKGNENFQIFQQTFRKYELSL